MAKLSQHNIAHLPSASPPSPTSVHQRAELEGPKDVMSQALLLQLSRLRRRRQRELLLQIDEDRRMQRSPAATASFSEAVDTNQCGRPDRSNSFLCSSLSLSTLDFQKNSTIVEEEDEGSSNSGAGDDSRSLFSNEDSSLDSS
jgi:hypothetical protein